jgi:hypothetical protein
VQRTTFKDKKSEDEDENGLAVEKLLGNHDLFDTEA